MAYQMPKPELDTHFLTPIKPRKGATKITLTSPGRSPRSRTINVLHSKLEYERQIQDQLLLEQQKEIEALQSDLDQSNLNSSQLNLSLNDQQLQLQNSSEQMKQFQNKYAQVKKENSELQNTLTELQSNHYKKVEELAKSLEKITQIQSKYDSTVGCMKEKDLIISNLKHKIELLRHSVTDNSKENTELIKTNSCLDTNMHKLKAKNESLKQKIESVSDNCDKNKDELRVCKEKISIYEDQITTYDNLLKDKCKEIEACEHNQSLLKQKHSKEIETLKSLIDDTKCSSSQQVFELESKYFSAKESIAHYAQIEKEYKVLKQELHDLKSKTQVQDFEVHKKISKIRRLTEEQQNNDSLLRRLKTENSTLTDSITHYRTKSEQLKQEMNYYKTHSDKGHKLEQKMRNLISENSQFRNNLAQILSQPAKISCSYNRFCENPLCNKPQFAWLSVPLDELSRLKKFVNLSEATFDSNHFNHYSLLSSVNSDPQHYDSCTNAKSKSYCNNTARSPKSELNRHAPHKIDININNPTPSSLFESNHRSSLSENRNYCNCTRKNRLQQLRDLVQDRKALRRLY